MSMAKFLAILVVAAMCLGCDSLLGGPQNCEFGVQGWGCAPNPDSADGVSYGDGYSSPETNTNTDSVDTENSLTKVCKKFLWLDGSEWKCTIEASVEEDVVLWLLVEDGVCWVATTPKFLGAPGAKLNFLTNGQMEFPYSTGKAICNQKTH